MTTNEKISQSKGKYSSGSQERRRSRQGKLYFSENPPLETFRDMNPQTSKQTPISSKKDKKALRSNKHRRDKNTSLHWVPKSSRPNWLELPEDVMVLILSPVGALEILTSVQMVCKTWHHICKNPLIWHTIVIGEPDILIISYLNDLSYHSNESKKMRRYAGNPSYLKFLYTFKDVKKMCRLAIDRSCGNLVDISVDHFTTRKLVKYIANSSNRIRRLRLVHFHRITYEELSEVASKLPLLEDLELSLCRLPQNSLEAIGRACPLLKSLKLNRELMVPRDPDDNDALAIAQTMHGLRHLQLFRNKLTDESLREILDSCPHLESLDLRQCYELYPWGDWKRRCERIKILRLPNDSTDDYEFSATLFDTNFDHDSDYLKYNHDRDRSQLALAS